MPAGPRHPLSRDLGPAWRHPTVHPGREHGGEQAAASTVGDGWVTAANEEQQQQHFGGERRRRLPQGTRAARPALPLASTSSAPRAEDGSGAHTVLQYAVGYHQGLGPLRRLTPAQELNRVALVRRSPWLGRSGSRRLPSGVPAG